MKEIIASLAADLGDPNVTAEAIRKWEARGKVPHKHRIPLLELAERRRAKITKRDFEFEPKPKKRARAA